jgi:dTDP-4-dehydro-6-deoxy-alpha-D-glucopyranose 2,3-dehydratase
MAATFDQALGAYEAFLGGHAPETRSGLRAEAHVEGMKDWSPLHTLDEIKAWFLDQRESCPMTLEDIPLLECQRWTLDKETGFLGHDSGDFFYVQGLRVHLSNMREVQSGWDQPMLTQVGFDGGILGLLRKRIRGVPMYLIEAKVEPGNYRLVQMSPTIQATFANLRRAHGGRAPHFADYFTDPAAHGAAVHFDQWLSEDGGRLTNKRNRGMLIEVPEDHDVTLPSETFRWLSLWQIKECLHEDAWVNPHVRGIIAHL